MKKHDFIVTTPAGMTLIELLVVISILGLLTIIVIPALSGNRENNANRNASQQVSGLISQSRNDAISAGRWAGFTVETTELDIARCRVPPPYQGDMTSSMVRFEYDPTAISPIPPRVRENSGGELSSFDDVGVRIGDFITFAGRSQRYRVSSNSSLIGPPPRRTFGITLVGSTTTQPWPPTDVPMPFSIERQPRVVGSTISLSTESSIDMRWSGYGDMSSYTTFWDGNPPVGSPPAPDPNNVIPQVSVLFDERGTLREIIRNNPVTNVVDRIPPDGAVFFLIGRVDRRANLYNSAAGPSATDDTLGANWQYPTSYWVVIDPVSGQTRIAECFQGATTPEASQQYVREGLISQGL